MSDKYTKLRMKMLRRKIKDITIERRLLLNEQRKYRVELDLKKEQEKNKWNQKPQKKRWWKIR